MFSTPQEWLPELAKRLDSRYPRIATNRAYTTGRAPLPEMGDNLRASWEMFQRKACTDYGGLAVKSLANRIIPNRITIGDSDVGEAVTAARRIWRDNRLDIVVADAINDYLSTSIGHLVVGRDPEDGSAIVTSERPEMFIAVTDPTRPWRVVAALKAWRDDVRGADFAYVWMKGAGQKFRRSTSNGHGVTWSKVSGGGWEPDGPVEAFDGNPPVVVLDRVMGFVEPHHGVIDRVNLGKLNRLVIVAMQAFRQRGLKMPQGVNPGEDEETGDQIDLAKVFEPAPGALWELPDGIDVWESANTDITPLIGGEVQDAKDFAAVTQTPISVFIPDGTNQSAEGAAAATSGQVFQANTEIRNIVPNLAVMLVYALRVEGVDLDGQTVEIGTVPADRVSMSEKYAAAAAAKSAGESWQSIARNILGYSQQQIEQDATARAVEQLEMAMLTGAGNGAGDT